MLRKSPRPGLWLACGILVFPAALAAAAQGPKDGPFEETWPNGNKKIEACYKDGLLHGALREYHENGKLRFTAHYEKGQLHGVCSEYHSNGRKKSETQYLEGKRHGPSRSYPESGASAGPEELYVYGALAYPRTLPEIKATLLKLLPAKTKEKLYLEQPSSTGTMAAGKVHPAHLDGALARLKAHRYLAGLPYEDLTLNEEYNRQAQHAAVLLSRIGKLTHTPAKPPGVDDAYFKLGYEGCSHSNLHQGMGTLEGALDGFMDDSDASNIARLGHRRWCLNPQMKQAGFGICSGFVALWALDSSRKDTPPYDYIAYPVRGYQLLDFFRANAAWSVGLNPAKYAAPVKGQVKAVVFPLDERFRKAPAPLSLNFENVASAGFGSSHCVMFRPAGLKFSAGARYLVELGGLKAKDGSNAEIAYMVEFAK